MEKACLDVTQLLRAVCDYNIVICTHLYAQQELRLFWYLFHWYISLIGLRT